MLKVLCLLDLEYYQALDKDVITSLSAYAEGTIISALAQTTISQGVVDKHPIFKLSIGQLTVGIRGCVMYVFKPNLWSAVIFKGWTLY